MTSTDSKEAHTNPCPEDANVMSKHGITVVPIEYFHCGVFRYTNMEDAVAQAKREQLSMDSSPTNGSEDASTEGDAAPLPDHG